MSATHFAPTETSHHSTQHAFEVPAQGLGDVCPVPPIERDRLLERCLNNVDFALMLLGEFEKEHQTRLDALRTALAEKCNTAIASQAHALKGVAGVLAASTLMTTCAVLESAAHQADWDQIREQIEQLHHEMQRAIEFIPNIRAQD